MTATEPAVELRDHPAKFHDDLLHTIRDLLLAHDVPLGEPVIDPFAGTGKIHQLADMWDTTGVELEPEWAGHHERTIVGDARHLDHLFEPGSFAACVTSPCYGNRFADTYTRSTITCKPCKGTGHVTDDKAPIGSRPCETCDGSGRRATRRYNYASSLGRRPSQGSSAVLHWGPAYRTFHDTCWRQVRHVVIPGGLFILNIKDHQRDRRRQYVTDWHVRTLGRLGFRYLTAQAVDTGSMRHGENWEARFPEQLIVFEAPGIHQLDLGGAL